MTETSLYWIFWAVWVSGLVTYFTARKRNQRATDIGVIIEALGLGGMLACTIMHYALCAEVITNGVYL